MRVRVRYIDTHIMRVCVCVYLNIVRNANRHRRKRNNLIYRIDSRYNSGSNTTQIETPGRLASGLIEAHARCTHDLLGNNNVILRHTVPYGPPDRNGTDRPNKISLSRTVSCWRFRNHSKITSACNIIDRYGFVLILVIIIISDDD
jgi:hypothetical protein